MERVFSAGHPDPQEIEKAKKVLKVRKHANCQQQSYIAILDAGYGFDYLILLIQEHEQALADAIARLADISDGESGMYSWFKAVHLSFDMPFPFPTPPHPVQSNWVFTFYINIL